MLRCRVDWEGRTAIEATHASNTSDSVMVSRELATLKVVLTLIPKPILPGLLPSELLHGERDGVQHACQVNIEHRQVWHLESGCRRVIGYGDTFADPRDGIDIVDSTKVCHGLTESFDLGIPARSINTSASGNLGTLVELVNELLGALEISVGDEYFDVGIWSVITSRVAASSNARFPTCSSLACEPPLRRSRKLL